MAIKSHVATREIRPFPIGHQASAIHSSTYTSTKMERLVMRDAIRGHQRSSTYTSTKMERLG